MLLDPHPELVKVSAGYRANVVLVLLSIFVFIAGYLFTLGASVLLVYGGFKLIGIVLQGHTHIITLLLSIGILIMVFMIFFFMIKFLFKTGTEENKGHVEITREQHPRLFDFVEKVCAEAKAPFPKKIVLSTKVNASVFYNSSFLSMFFPVRKNLEIGLGLVNCVNMSEFKAVVAHEFGHFSQSSTRLGSYVYRLNGMIHNLLYDNQGWEEVLKSITSWHAVVSFFGRITVEIVKLALTFLIELHKIINKSYLALSRQMEFHADSVAVSVSGSKPIISALHRLEFAQGVYIYTLQGINACCKGKNRYPENFFKLMQRNIRVQAKLNDLGFENELPVINSHVISSQFFENRVKYKDVWNSHPPILEREANANRIPLEMPVDISSPWQLFNAPENLQEQMSKELIELEVKEKGEISNAELEQYFDTEEKKSYIHPVYNGFYAYADLTFVAPEKDEQIISQLTWDNLFGNEIMQRLKRYRKNQEDAAILNAMVAEHIRVSKFEFDGKVVYREKLPELTKQLTEEINVDTTFFSQHKQKIANWFYTVAQSKSTPLAQKYNNLMNFRVRMSNDMKPFMDLVNELIEFYNKELKREITMEELTEIKKKIETYYKKFIDAKAAINNQNIPSIVQTELFSRKGYKETVFNKNIENPNQKNNLEGFVLFFQALEELIKDWAELDWHVFKLVIKTQDEVLKQEGLIA